MAETQKYSIRPAGRHILTIGSDLIQDQYAAIVELVKNAYDADSHDVTITFRVSKNRNVFTIIVADHGHGMSRDTVINKWLVPSTDDKLKRRISPGGRTMQGRKGIGRYAASILGDDLLLETVTSEKEKTVVYVCWNDFSNAKYLDDVEILVETKHIDKPSGTILTITGTGKHLGEWDEKQVRKLQFELKKLISPVFHLLEQDSFSITLCFDNFLQDQTALVSEKIEPYPIFELYDYKVSGSIDEKGNGELVYANQRARNTIEEKIDLKLGQTTGCGRLVFDIRVYDREPAAIDQLIQRGLKDDKGDYVGKLDARRLLNEYNGIGVYRNGFRLRPLGDPDFDWLKLNEQRIQNPSFRIGINQTIGYIQIEAEEQSALQEKSARDGLRENNAYERLKEIICSVIAELEERRFAYRSKAGLSRTTLKIERQMEKLFAFDELKRGIRSKLLGSGITEQATNEIIDIISRKEEENNRIAEDLRQAVAIYQGQATLGKIINVILHEGRRPLSYFKNQIPTLNFWAQELKKKYEPESLDEVIQLTEGIGNNAKSFVSLFGRLDPLAAGKRGPKKKFNIKEAIYNSFQVFENELISNKIGYRINCTENLISTGWQQDIYVIMTNLIDNSIFWIIEKQSPVRNIEVTVCEEAGKITNIDYRDSGPGIEAHLIESGVIFEPEFTTKNNGTGLGLAIAGEAASRNGFELKAFESDNGAYFRLQSSDGTPL